MLFSSVTFLYFFLPVVLGLYFLAPEKMQKTRCCFSHRSSFMLMGNRVLCCFRCS